MAIGLRKVKFFVERKEGFTPDLDMVDRRNYEEQKLEQNGYFHCWVCEERKSEQSGLFREETVALVEDALTGKMYRIDYDLIRFIPE